MFANFMINAWEAATIVAIVAGVVGFFTVLRGAAFAAHSLPNGAFAGAAGAFLIGANTIVGLGVFSLAGAGMIAGLGRRARSDVATALTIVLMLALGDLFLSRTSEYAPEIFALLFGEVLGVSTSKLGPTVVIAAVCIVAVAVLYRPLMLSSVTPDVAEARGINPRVMDLAFLVVVALVTTMAVPVVGSLLIFSLLIGPPAAARSFTNRPPVAIGLSVLFALVTVWVAIAVSYETNLPIGFFVGAISAFAYTVGRAWTAWQQTRGRRRQGARDRATLADFADGAQRMRRSDDARGRLQQQRSAASTPNGIRTRVSALKGRCPRPLDDGGSTRRRKRKLPGAGLLAGRGRTFRRSATRDRPACPAPRSRTPPAGRVRSRPPQSGGPLWRRLGAGGESPRTARRPGEGLWRRSRRGGPISRISERRLAWARSSSSPAGMSVDQAVTSRSRSSTVLTAAAMSRAATAVAKSASARALGRRGAMC